MREVYGIHVDGSKNEANPDKCEAILKMRKSE